MTSVLLHLLVRADSSLSLSSYSIVCLLLLAALLYPLYLFLDYTLVQPYTRYRVLASQGIRGPPFIPFVGALPILGWYVFHDKLLDWTTDVVERYGPVSRHERGPITVLQLQDVDYVMAAWKTQARHYRRGSIVTYIRQFTLGKDSLLVTEDAVHARHRQMISPALHYAQLADMSSIMARETIAAIDALIPPSSTATTTVELHSWFTSLTLSIICSSSFGDALKQRPEAKAILQHSLSNLLPIVAKRTILLAHFIPIIRSLPILGKREADRGLAAFQSIVLQMVVDRKAGRSRSQCSGRDLLDLLISARDPVTGSCFTDEQLRANAATFLLAGHETTSSLMTWVLRDLLTRPVLWRQLRDEVQRVTEGEMVTAAHVPQLTTIDACIHESFRLRPPAHQIVQEAADDHWLQPHVEAGGESKPHIFVKKGTVLFHDILAMQRSCDVWGDDAEQWDEQRWLKHSDTYRKPAHPAAFMGFSIGRYSCIGQSFALMEAKIMLAEMVRRLDVDMLPGQTDRIKKRLTLIPRDGLKATVRRAAPDTLTRLCCR